MRPATAAVPKEFLPIVDRPLIDHSLTEVANLDVRRLVFVLSSTKADMQSYLSERIPEIYTAAERKPPDVMFCEQSAPQGFGDAVLCARDALDTAPFMVVAPDDLLTEGTASLRRLQDTKAAIALLVCVVPAEHTSRYGIVDIEDAAIPQASEPTTLPVRAIVEKPARAPSRYGVIGRYVLPHSILAALAQQSPGAGGEIQLTDAVMTLIQQGARCEAVLATGVRHDCGSRDGWLAANVHYAMADPQWRQSVLTQTQEHSP